LYDSLGSADGGGGGDFLIFFSVRISVGMIIFCVIYFGWLHDVVSELCKPIFLRINFILSVEENMKVIIADNLPGLNAAERLF